METVNTIGLPFYARMEERRLGRGYGIEVQTNPPVFLVQRPGRLRTRQVENITELGQKKLRVGLL